MRFLTYHVHGTKCLLDINYKQNPNQIVLALKLDGHHMTPGDAYTKWIESHYATILDVYASNAKTVVAM